MQISVAFHFLLRQRPQRRLLRCLQDGPGEKRRVIISRPVNPFSRKPTLNLVILFSIGRRVFLSRMALWSKTWNEPVRILDRLGPLQTMFWMTRAKTRLALVPNSIRASTRAKLGLARGPSLISTIAVDLSHFPVPSRTTRAVANM